MREGSGGKEKDKERERKKERKKEEGGYMKMLYHHYQPPLAITSTIHYYYYYYYHYYDTPPLIALYEVSRLRSCFNGCRGPRGGNAYNTRCWGNTQLASKGGVQEAVHSSSYLLS